MVGEGYWKITTWNLSKGASRTLTVSLDDDDRFYLAVGGAVEVYNISSCNQYPQDGISFTNLKLWDDNWSQITPSWGEVVDDTVTPQCDFDVDAGTTTVDLFHNPYEDPPPLDASIDGPTMVRPGATCTWFSNVTGGVSPYTYQWSGKLSGSWNFVSGELYSSGYLYLDVADSQQPPDTDGHALWITVSPTAPWCDEEK